MRKISSLCFILAIVLCNPINANSYVYGGSNLTYSRYPDHNCSEPYKPYNPDKYQWDLFKMEIENYKMCIEEYVENAENDMKRAQEAANDAINDFNIFINML